MRNLSQLYADWRAATARYRQLEADTPRLIGAISVKVTRENFDAQGYVENVGAVQRWKKRSPVTDKIYDSRKGVKGSVYSSKNPILLQTGNLKNAIMYQATAKKVEVGVNLALVPYAKLMNEGGFAVFGTRVVKIPKRAYIGISQKLKNNIAKEIEDRRDKIFKEFKI